MTLLAKKFKLITFDMINTLIKYRSSPKNQYGEIGSMFGVHSDKIFDAWKIHWDEMSNKHPNYGLKTIGWEKWWVEMTKLSFKHGLKEPNEKKLDALAAHMIEVYKTSMYWQNCFGSPEILKYLKKNYDVKMGIIDNFDSRLEAIATNMRIRPYFDFILNSYEAGALKPSKDIYMQAMELSEIKDLKSDEVLHIGNTVDLDYMGAKAAGFASILINDQDPAKLVKSNPNVNPNHILRSLYDLHRHLVTDSVKW